MLQRTLVILIFGPIALGLVYLGGWFYFIPVLFILLLASTEFNHMMREMGLQTSVWLISASVFALSTAVFLQPDWFMPVLILSLLIVMIYTLWQYERQSSKTAVANWMATTGGIILLGVVGTHFLRLRGIETKIGWEWTILALLSTWTADSGAYLVGKFMAGNILGRHQLSPRLSPNKTIEGYIGGIILGTTLTILFAYFLNISFVPALIMGILASVISPMGDLGISLLKRVSKVKDSGTIFGEHGGALDRIDSVIWSVALAYYITLLFQ